MPVSFNVRKILESGDLDEAIAYLKNTRFAQAMNYMIGDRERVIAGVDCGFGTFAGYSLVADDVVWAKLEALSTGAALASQRRWSRS